MFSFEHPEYFRWMGVAPAMVAVWWLYLRWRRRSLLRLAAPTAQERILPGWSAKRFWLKNGLLLMAVVLLIVAAANPRRGVLQQAVQQRSADVFIALDLSLSMLAQDASPSRLERAKVFARRLARALSNERVGVVFFAGSAYVAMPLSLDHGAADMLLRAATPDLLSTPGSDLGAALLVALEHFDPDPDAGRAVVLISDGEDHEGRLSQATARLRDAGVIVFCVGVGTSEGTLIPLAEGEYKRDPSGRPILTRANEGALRQIAAATKGEYYSLQQGDDALEAIRREIGQLDRRAVQGRSFEEFESYYAYFVLPAFLLLTLYVALGWRVRSVPLLLLLALQSSPLRAQSAHRLLRQGDRHYSEERYKEAESAYREARRKDPQNPQALYNQGNALYKQGKYAEAQQAWQKALPYIGDPARKADLWHNLGNALLRQGRLEEAISAYENSLRLRPGDLDTKINLQLARKKQKQSQPPTGDSTANATPHTSAEQVPPPEQPPKPDEEQPGKLSPREARQLLETTVAPQDQNSGRKYREQTPQSHQKRLRKDW